MYCERHIGKLEVIIADTSNSPSDLICDSRKSTPDRERNLHSRGQHLRGRISIFRGGFSLIEIMVVIVIIALLASIVGINVKSYRDKASQKKARADIAVYVTAMKSFYADKGRYPTMSEGLEILAPEYIDQISLDPWGNAYQLEVPGAEGAFDIICFGADGSEGGEGVDQDLTNWNAGSEDQQ